MVAQKTTMAVRLAFLFYHYCLVHIEPLWKFSYLLDQDTIVNIKSEVFIVPKFSLIFIQALRQLRQIAHEVSQSNVTGWGRRPAALRALSQRLSRLTYSHHLI
jgi:hypothetical protein